MEYTLGEWKTFISDHFVQVHTGKTGITLPLSEENIANAHLIAAAPDMYEALKALVSVCREVSYTHSELSKARQALAKAEGQPAGTCPEGVERHVTTCY